MGSGRDKRKKSKGHKPGQGADKTAKKTERNVEKAQRRLERMAKGGEDDIDALLAQFKLQDEASVTVRIEEDCPPPGPRVYPSFQPMNDKEIIMFGGEWYDGELDKMHVYADLYVLNTESMAWRRVISPGGPLPRTSHQAVVTRSHMYIFGGEFTSLNQTKFKHYGDLWRLNLTTWQWEQLPSKGGPSPRSGHRMVLYKGQIILFGGFFDASKEVKYYNDVWVYTIETLKWECLTLSRSGNNGPSPRGGCQLALHPESSTLFVIGGYSVREQTGTANEPFILKEGGKRGKSSEEDAEGKGVVHDDVWALDLKVKTWERVKKAGMVPSARTSFGLVVHKARAILFGGVFDREGAGDKLYSELYNEAYQFNMTSKRWFPLTMRSTARPKMDSNIIEEEEKPPPKGPPPPGVSPELHEALLRLKGSGDTKSPLMQAAIRIQAAFRGHMVRSAMRSYKLGGKIPELLYSPATYGIDLSAKDIIRPRARASPSMTVLRNKLWLWGGQVEIGHTDIVLDDLWTLDLVKLDGWQCVKENTAGEDAFKELQEDSDDESLSGWETDDN
jgi:N-acetylneuraminic acid mutarotase